MRKIVLTFFLMTGIFSISQHENISNGSSSPSNYDYFNVLPSEETWRFGGVVTPEVYQLMDELEQQFFLDCLDSLGLTDCNLKAYSNSLMDTLKKDIRYYHQTVAARTNNPRYTSISPLRNNGVAYLPGKHSLAEPEVMVMFLREAGYFTVFVVLWG